MREVRTDLAVESARSLPNLPQGVSLDEETFSDLVRIERVEITSEEGSAQLRKPQGSYITMIAPTLLEGEPQTVEDCAKAFAAQLKGLINHQLTQQDIVLIVGLGNRTVTPDSIGPLVVERLLVTRHLFSLLPDKIDSRAGCVAAIAPGVLGDTGLESGEVIAALVQKLSPRCVIAIDALCAMDANRLATTVQLSDTGIAPGAGVGNHRPRLDEALLGVPVYAVGVPTVVHMQSLMDLDDMDEAQRALFETLYVTPKDIDTIAKNCAKVIATGLNMAMHGDLAYAQALDLVVS